MKVYESETEMHSRVFLCVWTHMRADEWQKYIQLLTTPHKTQAREVSYWKKSPFYTNREWCARVFSNSINCIPEQEWFFLA